MMPAAYRADTVARAMAGEYVSLAGGRVALVHAPCGSDDRVTRTYLATVDGRRVRVVYAACRRCRRAESYGPAVRP